MFGKRAPFPLISSLLPVEVLLGELEKVADAVQAVLFPFSLEPLRTTAPPCRGWPSR